MIEHMGASEITNVLTTGMLVLQSHHDLNISLTFILERIATKMRSERSLAQT